MLAALTAGLLTFTGCDDDDDNGNIIVPPVPVAYDITGSTDLTMHPDFDATNNTLYFYKANQYTIEGLVYVPSGVTLDIEEGTVIKAKELTGDDDGATALIITRGAMINAEGTADEPIIMTAFDDDVDNPSDLDGSDNGLWGGLVILGEGIISNAGSPVANIEGIDPEARTEYGGMNNGDNSGTVRYLSIRHSGAELAPGDELQGLTIGGVGSGTTIEYVESFASSDDGIEIFGGGVNVKNLAVAFAEDDCFDLDMGWSGNCQFLFTIKAENTGNRMAEWDGAKPDDSDIFTSATIANATMIGSGNSSDNDENDVAILMRDGFGGKLYNSIISEVNGYGIEVEDIEAEKDANQMDSYSKLERDVIVISGNVFNVRRNTFDVNADTGLINVTSDDNGVIADDPMQAVLAAELSANNAIYNGNLFSINRTAGANGINPIPVTTNFDVGPSTLPSGFENANYQGAFDPASAQTWLNGWTALSQLGYLAN